jgi:transposase
MFIMEDVGKKSRRPRRAFTPEFNAEIVEVCRRGDRSIGQVAKDFDLTETAVREWVRQADIDDGARSDGLTNAEREELAALRREPSGLGRAWPPTGIHPRHGRTGRAGWWDEQQHPRPGP